MSLKRDIQSAYDQVHAPEDVIERMKRELREKDLRGDTEQTADLMERAPRPQLWRYLVYIAAVFAVFGCGVMAWNSAQQQRVLLHPATQVQETAVPDVTGMTLEEAQKRLQQAGYHVVIAYETSDLPEGTVIRTDPKTGTEQSGGEVTVYLSTGSV